MTNQECREHWDRKYTFREITATWQLLATLRNGQFAWPGGYPMFFITSDGGSLSFQTVREELAGVIDSIRSDISDGWKVVACGVNWDDSELVDDHSGELIESAYRE